MHTALNVSEAARTCGIAPATAYRWRHTDPTFSIEWDEARDEGIDALEAEARRRAFKGSERPVFHKGDQCGVILDYSDALAMFLLKGYRRSVFGDASKIDLTPNATGGGPLPELNDLERAKRVNELLALAEASKAVADLV